MSPSLAVVAPPVIVTVGLTLAIVTTRLSELPAPGSSSLAVTRTVELAGPSGKVQSKPLGAAVPVRLPLVPPRRR